MNSVRTLVRALYARVEHLIHELAKFGIVGAIAFVVDVGTFNLLRNGAMHDRPLTAKVISTILATTVAFAGNRQWTFRHRERAGLRREYMLFFVLNAVGLAIALSCLGVSHYLLDFTSPLADNLSANGVGMVLGTMFRFWSYRKFVFTATAVPRAEPTADPVAA
ncbi:GtrA family protein [Sporichthya sp.]|uniref:GtrA family protein n=1 Tax=Sporichthya sp. TaxID=65475 RepID=UPI0017B2D5E7|nr:GtrA family protein [Sporichthya sp.]MBA3742818.1 GtrA family protein [Sporichthya sp.]